MFIGYILKALLPLFAFNMQSTVTQNGASGNVANSTQTTTTTTRGPHDVDDLSKFDWHTYCKFQANAHKCTVRTQRRYYFDLQLHRCVRFEYGSCNHTYNMFDGRHTCMSSCEDVAYSRAFTNVTANVYCRYQPDFGDCNSYHPMWYFDVTEMRCRGFSYSGCGGNYNRFQSSTICLAVCGVAVRQD